MKPGAPSAAKSLASALAGRSWKQAAELLTEQAFFPAMERQRDRAASAQTLGLVHDDHLEPLSFDRMLIDRTVLTILDERGIDARAIRATDCRAGTFDALQVIVDVSTQRFEITHAGAGTPRIATWLALPSGRYDGAHLVVTGVLPETALAAAAGRRLGELVAIDRPHLAERRIVAAEGWDPASSRRTLTPVTWIRLEADDVPISWRPSAT